MTGSLKGITALVTGASSGIGEATVAALIAQDAIVYAAARRVERMRHLEEMGARILAMDLTEEASMMRGAGKIIDETGSIDILVNNAGYGSYGPVEDVSMEEARRQFEVNLFGLARVTQLVLPGMRAKRYGRIVNISSIGGKTYAPFGAWYIATKHALEGWSDCLRVETRPFGIDVVIIEPGGVATEWGGIAADHLIETSKDGAYARAAAKSARTMARRAQGGGFSAPTVISDVIVKAVTAKRPRTRYAAGAFAGTMLFLRRWLSDRMFDRFIALTR